MKAAKSATVAKRLAAEAVRSMSPTRKKLLDEALGLASTAGLSGVTLGVLAERAGMSKSGVFAHFRSKEDVLLGLLDYSATLFVPTVVAPSLQQPEGLPRLQAIVRNWLGWARKAGLPGGCPAAAAMFEFDDLEDPVRDSIIEREARWRSQLRGLVERAVELGHLRNDLDAEQFVWEVGGIYLIHHVDQRFLRHVDADARAATAFDALVDRARPPIHTAGIRRSNPRKRAVR